ncbi:MAG: class I SAM-dependent methyltransferase [Thermoanaerobaculia bacterium]
MTAPAAEHRLAEWRRVWGENRVAPEGLPLGSRGGLRGWLRRLWRRIVVSPQADLWERQRQYNDDLASGLAQAPLEGAYYRLGQDLQTIQRELSADILTSKQALFGDLQKIEGRVLHLEGFKTSGLDAVMRHMDALGALLDQKLEGYRRGALQMEARIGAMLAAVEAEGGAGLARAVTELAYVELQRRCRGTEAEVTDRLLPYLPYLRGAPGEVLDLGCGRGEALAVLESHGFRARGVDTNTAMVAACRAQGLRASEADLETELAQTPGGTLGGVISFHVVEHLEPRMLERVVRLSWQALAPGGVLIVETPSCLSLKVGASEFWRDPTHRSPVHPDSLKLSFELAGFEEVERVDRQPFPQAERLPEIDVEGAAAELRPTVERIAALRDHLDQLLYGFQDYGIIGRKPKGVAERSARR